MKRFFWQAVISTAMVAALASASAVRATNDFLITITDSAASQNQTMIFEEKTVGPGFEAAYNIHIDNQSAQFVKVLLHDFAEDAANSISLNELGLKFSQGDVLLAEILPENVAIGSEFVCIPPYANGTFTLNIYLDPTIGNEYQNMSYYADIAFRADAAECQTPPLELGWSDNGGNPGGDRPNLPLIPNTGESRGFYYFLYGAIAFFAILTAIFLILFIIARRRDSDQTSRPERRR
jgi:hypothetical protein